MHTYTHIFLCVSLYDMDLTYQVQIQDEALRIKVWIGLFISTDG